MALGFANVDYAILTRLNHNLSDRPHLIEFYEYLIVKHKIKGLYEKLGLLNILSFDGFTTGYMCKRTNAGLKKLYDKGLTFIDNNDEYQLKEECPFKPTPGLKFTYGFIDQKITRLK